MFNYFNQLVDFFATRMSSGKQIRTIYLLMFLKRMIMCNLHYSRPRGGLPKRQYQYL